MRTITIVNSKGGSGKSTLATNLASYFACWGIRVTLVDSDPQASALDWLRARPDDRPRIKGVVAEEGDFRIPPESDYAVIDVPSGTGGRTLRRLLRKSDVLVIPVLPSPMDIRATRKFIFELLQQEELTRRGIDICVVANRVRENTRIYYTLEKFLASVGVPFIAKFRDTQNYVQAADRGLGVFELAPARVIRDLRQWEPLVTWLSADKRISVIPPIASAEDMPGSDDSDPPTAAQTH